VLLPILATVIGLVVLAWSADKFVDGASAIARYLGMAPLLVGMLVIGFGTSAPELVVSALAAADGSPELAVGNALGSNVANIGLILGITAILTPIIVSRGILRRELPLLLGVTLLAGALMWDLHISRADAVVLIAALAAVMAWSGWQAHKHPEDSLAKDVEAETQTQGLSRKAAWIWLGVGLIILVLSSRLLVWGAVEIAGALGWSELVIGLTVVAIGTSAPELASSIAAARKGENDLALGNIIGSNMFNTLGVLGFAALIAPATVSADVLNRDLPVVFILTAALVMFAVWPLGKGRINRVEGGILLAAFVAYTAYLIAVVA
jgi:cation:H+ antiporter